MPNRVLLHMLCLITCVQEIEQAVVTIHDQMRFLMAWMICIKYNEEYHGSNIKGKKQAISSDESAR